jgi:hypothetical protein
MHGGGFILEFVKCYIGFCTQGALKWIRKKKKKKEYVSVAHHKLKERGIVMWKAV